MKVNSFIQHLSEGLYDPGIFKAFFLAGGPGSGKTFVTSSAFAGSGLKVVNSDVAFERGLKKANLSLSMPDEETYFRNIIRNRAKALTISQLDKYVDGRLGLVIDSTGRDYDMIARHHNMLQQMGYDCGCFFGSIGPTFPPRRCFLILSLISLSISSALYSCSASIGICKMFLIIAIVI